MFDLWLFVSFNYNQSIILKTCFFLNQYNRHFFFQKLSTPITNLFQQKTTNQSINQLTPFKNISLKKKRSKVGFNKQQQHLYTKEEEEEKNLLIMKSHQSPCGVDPKYPINMKSTIEELHRYT